MSNAISTCADVINPLNAELNPIRHLLALVGARHIVHVSRIWVNISQTPNGVYRIVCPLQKTVEERNSDVIKLLNTHLLSLKMMAI